MKSQDIFILLKLASLQAQENKDLSSVDAALYTVRGLAEELGVGKSEINNSINRSISVGLLKRDRKNNLPRPNLKALREFIVYGLKYVFPAKPSEITRGIPTAFAAPMLKGQLMTAGEMIYVWPDAKGRDKGQSVTPLFKTVPYAIKRDSRLYTSLALVDAIRLGGPREAHLAEQLLAESLEA
ncbi:hypothetical protein [Geothermobacter hydrogeniphilus]|uniref:Uncharacterized protein n=1 Tax=Geothermobacter hydrogeniphilus TaxID=1969733 RepID=A0A1X0Y2B6_9BACT|nr:hypothetical protein [Geothermobacter hydrogeniphilus]ORJ59259.1 hypothetical protein B5V00_10190 [Geothermobacter hydrogeniphilus]